MDGQNPNGFVNIRWSEQPSYESAIKVGQCAYLVEWDGEVSYVGYTDDFKTRYLGGYRSWIEGGLAHGAKLFTGQLCGELKFRPTSKDLRKETEGRIKQQLKAVEAMLIDRLRPQQNRQIPSYVPRLLLEHSGDVPACLVG